MLIAVDHGNKQIKTVHTPPFTSGLIQSDTPGFGTDALAYRGKYYTLTDQRIPYRRDKTEDERFFILTLFAIAHEIEAMEQYSGSLMRVQLAVGLPPAHFGVQAKRFIEYQPLSLLISPPVVSFYLYTGRKQKKGQSLFKNFRRCAR